MVVLASRGMVYGIKREVPPDGSPSFKVASFIRLRDSLLLPSGRIQCAIGKSQYAKASDPDSRRRSRCSSRHRARFEEALRGAVPRVASGIRERRVGSSAPPPATE